MTIAFSSSVLKFDKTVDLESQNFSHSNELTSLLVKETSFSPYETRKSLHQKTDALIFTSDTYMAGCHFDLQDHPQDIARCMIRASLSNMAACGTHIKGYLIALSMPEDFDASWLEIFKATLVEEENYFQLSSLGDDISVTTGPLTLTLTFVGVRMIRPKVQAQLGDRIYVTGFLGDREMGHFLSRASSSEISTQFSDHDVHYLCTRYFQPDPHIILAKRLLPFINTCLSLSEGLIQDLTHLCSNSQLQAYIDLKSIPRSEALQRVGRKMNLDFSNYGFLKGKDRELLFTAPLSEENQISYLSHVFNLPITPIGYMGIQQEKGCKNYVSWLRDHLVHE